MKLICCLLIALPSMANAQSYYDPSDNTIVRPVYEAPRAPIVRQDTYGNGTTTTTGINPYTGQMWSNTTQSNGYTYGTDTQGRSYQDNVRQAPAQKAINEFMIRGMENLGAQVGGSVYDSQNGRE